jgi:hypothetical protein
MLRKELVIPPEVAKAFVRDMKHRALEACMNIVPPRHRASISGCEFVPDLTQATQGIWQALN